MNILYFNSLRSTTDYYEFLWLNGEGTKLYAGIYFKEGHDKSAKFVHKKDGVEYTGK